MTYNKVSVLGEGTFGKIFLVQLVDTGTQFAMKMLPKNDTALSILNSTEINIWKQMNHPRILQFREAVLFEDSVSLVMEYCPGGDLRTFLARLNEETLLEEKKVWGYFGDLCSALTYLEDMQVVHKNICPGSIYCYEDSIKLGDFGMEALNDMLMTSSLNTRDSDGIRYLAPELFHVTPPYSHKSDMWACGCVLFLMCTLKPPFAGNNYMGVMTSITNDEPAHISNIYSEELENVIRILLRKSPESRPRAADVVNFDFVKRHMNTIVPVGEFSSKFSKRGLQALSPSPQGDYQLVEWSSLSQCEVNFMQEWNSMLSGTEAKEGLLVPPLILLRSISTNTAVSIQLLRQGAHLTIHSTLLSLGVAVNSVEATLHFRFQCVKEKSSESSKERHHFVNLDQYSVITFINSSQHHHLFTFLNVPWSSLSPSHLPRAMISITQVKPIDRFSNLGFAPITCSPHGEFGSVEWTSMMKVLNYQVEWAKMVVNHTGAILNFAPMVIPTSSESLSVLNVFIRRKRDNLDVDMVYHDNVSKDVEAITVVMKMKMSLTFHKKAVSDKEPATTLVMEREGKGDVGHKQSKFPVFITFTGIPWKDLSKSHPPQASVSITPVHQSDKFAWNGLAALSPSKEGEYAPVDWAVLQGHQEWIDMVHTGEMSHLDLPPLCLPETLAVGTGAFLMSLRREQGTLQIWGMFHPKMDKTARPIRIILTVKLRIVKKNRVILKLKKQEHVSVSKENTVLMTFPNVRWDQISIEHVPTARLIIMAPLTLDSFAWKSMPPLAVASEQSAYVIDWEHLPDQHTRWRMVMQGGEGDSHRINFPPLILSSSRDSQPPKVLLLYGVRQGGELKIFASFHHNVSKYTEPQQTKMAFNIIFPLKHTPNTWSSRKETIVLLKTNFFVLFSLTDIPWDEFLVDDMPKAEIIFANVPSEQRFMWNGLRPVGWHENGFPLVDWATLSSSSFDYRAQWKKIVGGDRDARLHFPPFVLNKVPSLLSTVPETPVVFVLFITREGKRMEFAGGYHEMLPRDVAEPFLQAKLTVGLKLNKVNSTTGIESVQEVRLEETITIKYNLKGGFFRLTTFHEVPWGELNDSVPPQATVSIVPDRSE